MIGETSRRNVLRAGLGLLAGILVPLGDKAWLDDVQLVCLTCQSLAGAPTATTTLTPSGTVTATWSAMSTSRSIRPRWWAC